MIYINTEDSPWSPVTFNIWSKSVLRHIENIPALRIKTRQILKKLATYEQPLF